MTHQPGTLVGDRYRILKEINRGGFGITYLAENIRSANALCVVKQLDPQKAHIATAKKLFQREADVLSQLQETQQILKFLDYIETKTDFYLVEEYIEGKTLDKLLDRRWTKRETIDFLRQILLILKDLHYQNLVHRDINLSNIMLRDRDRKFVLIDFGSVKQLDTQDATPLNELGTVVCTPGYAPPEQMEGRPRLNSDLYALGLTAIQLTAGLRPNEVRRNTSDNIVWSDAEAPIDSALSAILTKMVHFNSENRYQSVSEVLHDLSKIDAKTELSDAVTIPPIQIGQKPFRFRSRSGKFRRRWLWGTIAAAVGIIGLTEIVHPVVRPALSIYQGNRLLDAHENPQKALSQFDRAIQLQRGALLFPTESAAAWMGRGDALFSQGRFEAAFEAYNRVSELSPSDRTIQIKSLLNKGKVLLNVNPPQPTEALKVCEEVRKLDGNNVEVWRVMGLAYIQARQYDKAAEASKELRSRQPDDPGIWQQIGIAVEQSDRQAAQQYFSEAKASYESVLNRKKDALTYTDYGSVLLKLGQPQQALEAYENALKMNEDFFEALMGKGNALDSLNRSDQALAAFKKATEVRSDDYLAWFNQAQILAYKLNKPDEALKALDQATRLNNQDFRSWITKGFLLKDMPNREKEALEALEQARKLSPNDPYVWAYRSDVLDKMGDAKGSQEAERKAKELGLPDDQNPQQ